MKLHLITESRLTDPDYDLAELKESLARVEEVLEERKERRMAIMLYQLVTVVREIAAAETGGGRRSHGGGNRGRRDGRGRPP